MCAKAASRAKGASGKRKLRGRPKSPVLRQEPTEGEELLIKAEDEPYESDPTDNDSDPDPNWSEKLMKTLKERKTFGPKVEKKDVDKKDRAWWNNRRRLYLLLEIMKYKDVHLSEDEWRDIAYKFPKSSWNGVRLEFSNLMRDYNKKVPKATAESALNNRSAAPAASTPAEPETEDSDNEEPANAKNGFPPGSFRKKRSSLLNARTKSSIYSPLLTWRKPIFAKNGKRYD